MLEAKAFYGAPPPAEPVVSKIINKKILNANAFRIFGAVNQIRTGDLFLTKEVLCLLSYNSKMATRNGLEPSTSSVTG